MRHPLQGLRSQERELAKGLLAQGWTLRKLRNNHLRLNHPDGVHGVTFPSSPSDWRGWKNLRADVRRIERAVREA
jgi:predicted RNA binding protein YcfA (HicA-like mRNA interferase family)